jgi:alpha-glucosidase
VRSVVDKYEAALPEGGWPNWVLGNHDQHRVASRIGVERARVAMMLLLTLRGTPTVYYGDELGMTDGEIPPHKVQDPQAVNQPELAAVWGRDPERTPMQWDTSPHAGFSEPDVEPWLPVASTFQTVNVARQEDDPRSMLALTRALTATRRAEPALHGGEYCSVDSGSPAVFTYVRSTGATRILVALNFSPDAARLDLGDLAPGGEILVATGVDRSGPAELTDLTVGAYEGLVIRLQA